MQSDTMSHRVTWTAIGIIILGLFASSALAGRGNVLPPTANPRGYALSDMAKATAYFDTGDRALNTPNAPFQILYVIDSQTSNTFEVSPGTMFYVPIVFTVEWPSQVVGVFPNINTRGDPIDYFYSQNQLGNNNTQIVVDGEVNSLGSDYVVGVPVPLADGALNILCPPHFLPPFEGHLYGRDPGVLHQFIERYIEWSGFSLTHLRPEIFMQNLLGYGGESYVKKGGIRHYVGDPTIRRQRPE
jgi:hypothetical protein